MSQIFALTQRNNERGWVHLEQGVDAEWEALAVNGSLQAMVDAAMLRQARHPKADFSFSFPRSATEFMALPLDKQPTADEMKALLPGYSLTFLMPIGNEHYNALWCHVWRDPRGGLSTNRKARFVSSLLATELRAWFNFYSAGRISKGLAGAVELHARHDWNAYAWFGQQAFPAPKGHPQSFLDAKAAYDARKAKGRGRPAKTAEAAQ